MIYGKTTESGDGCVPSMETDPKQVKENLK